MSPNVSKMIIHECSKWEAHHPGSSDLKLSDKPSLLVINSGYDHESRVKFEWWDFVASQVFSEEAGKLIVPI